MKQKKTGQFDQLSAVAVAAVWGITPQAVGLWHSKQGCPRNPDGTYNLAAVIAWREARIRAEADLEPGPGGGAQSPELEGWRRARRKMAELELERISGSLISLEEVERGRVERVIYLKRSMLALPRQVAPVLVGLEARQIQTLLKERLEDMIREYAGEGKGARRR